jgi:protein ECT2
MFNDVTLPDTEAWQALTRDLQTAKDARNTLTKENT